MFCKSHRGKKILILETDFLDREALSMVLATEGYMVPAAKGCDEAMAVLRSPERPDLILLDLSTGNEEVLTFCRTVRGEPAFATVPIVALTHKDTDRSILEGAHCLDKPVDTSRLLEAIGAHLLVPSAS
jgi:DNA-binding response OmpR family regulator